VAEKQKAPCAFCARYFQTRIQEAETHKTHCTHKELGLQGVCDLGQIVQNAGEFVKELAHQLADELFNELLNSLTGIKEKTTE